MSRTIVVSGYALTEYLRQPHVVRVETLEDVATITVSSPVSGQRSRVSVPIEGLRRWLVDKDLIQSALPELTDSERELLMTGYTDDDWDEEFGEEFDRVRHSRAPWHWHDEFPHNDGHPSRALTSPSGVVLRHKAAWRMKEGDMALIKAAPDMYEMLVKVLPEIEGSGVDDEVRALLRRVGS